MVALPSVVIITDDPGSPPSDGTQSPATSPDSSPDPSPSASVPPANPVLAPTEDMGQAYIDQIVFLGDSTTYGLKYYAMLSGGKDTTQVWTPASGTLTLSNQSIATIVYPETGEEITIVDAATRKQPAMMVITLGANGVSFMDLDWFISEYTALVQSIQRVSPNTKIMLQSIYPIAANYGSQDSINLQNISQANGWVQEVAAATGVRYLDTQSVLAIDNGYLPNDYQNGDGIHLNPTGFSVVLNYIRTHGYV